TVAVEAVQLVAEPVAERRDEQGPRGVVDVPGEEVVDVLVAGEGAATDLAADGGEAAADRGGVGGHRLERSGQPGAPVLAGGLVDRVSELLQGHRITAWCSFVRRKSSARGTTVCAVWEWRVSSTDTSP